LADYLGAGVAGLQFLDAYLVGFARNLVARWYSLAALYAAFEDGSHDVLDICISLVKPSEPEAIGMRTSARDGRHGVEAGSGRRVLLRVHEGVLSGSSEVAHCGETGYL
jgi:hypothetical protein